jgi:MATE family multidrug resistance protein
MEAAKNKQEDKKQKIPLPPTDNEPLTYSLAVWRLFELGGPIFMQEVFRYLPILSLYYYIGLIDNSDMLGGMGLAMMFYVSFTIAFLIGLDSVITTFTAQLIGMGKGKDSGQYYNAGVILNILICIPLLALTVFSRQIFLLWNQDEMISYYASRFLLGALPGYIPIALGTLNVFYLNSFRRSTPGLIATIA